ncbi:restriction endonuclease subunit S [Metamycoplasma spumans]|uniref:restriction endonuclease subunit S n=1 Tax=Metamycoplasma spumans TaxID=92406 RepID=UPI0034DD6726
MNKKNMPEIRFSGFDDEWKEEILKSVSWISIGNFVIKTKQKECYKYPVYNGGITNTGFYKNFNNIGPKIVISARGASAGFVNLVKGKYWAGNSSYTLNINKNINVDFLYQSIKKDDNAFNINLQSTSIPSVSKKDVENIDFKLPLPLEQLKIGNFLKNIDDLINKVEKQYNYFKKVKETLLNKMLPKDYSDFPDIRFKGFTNEWFYKTINDLVIYKTSTLTLNKLNKKGEYFVYDASQIVGKTTEAICNKHYISIIKDGAGAGRMRVLTPNTNIIGTMGAIISKKLDIYFILNSLYILDLSQQLNGTTIPHIYFKDYKNKRIKISNEYEITKVGSFFKNLDDLIALIKQKHEKLKNIKNALLDKMFC